MSGDARGSRGNGLGPRRGEKQRAPSVQPEGLGFLTSPGGGPPFQRLTLLSMPLVASLEPLQT